MTVPYRRILAIEASGESCSVALLDGEQGIRSRVSRESRKHAQMLLPMADDLLLEAGLSLSHIEALAFARGPGSFTGLRIGAGVIQGLAYGLQIPVLCANSLEVLALSACPSASAVDEHVVVATLDARMNEIYWAAYRVAGGRLQELQAPTLSSPNELNEGVAALRTASSSACRVVGNGAGNLASDPLDGEVQPSAESLLRLIDEGWSETIEYRDAWELELLYLRNEVAWQKRKRIRDNASRSAAS